MQNRNRLIVRLLVLVAVLSLIVGVTIAIDEVTPTPIPDPDVDVSALLDEAVIALQNGEVETGLDLIEQALVADPSNAEIYAIQGVAYVTFDDLPAALESFNTAIELTPYNIIYRGLRADTNIMLGEWDAVAADYTAIIALNPRNVDAYIGRAEANMELGNDTAAELDNLLGDCILNWQFGDVSGALEACGEVTASGETSDTVAAAYYMRGLIQYGRENLDTAIEEHTSAMAINPEMHDAYLARGIAARENDDLPLAGSDFMRRMELIERERFEQTVEYGDAIRIDMDYGYTHAIQFDAKAGDILTISARVEGGLIVDPLIALLDPSGTPIAGDDDFGGGLDSELERLTVDATGTYTLLVGHANGGFLGDIRVTFGPENTARLDQ